MYPGLAENLPVFKSSPGNPKTSRFQRISPGIRQALTRGEPNQNYVYKTNTHD